MTDASHTPGSRRPSPLALLVGGAFFMELLDGSIVNTALPAIARAFGTDPVGLNPAVSAYLLTVAVFILPSAWLADRYGPRRVFTFAIALFTAGSLLCALAWSPASLVAARIVQGVGGAMMVPVGRLAVLRSTPKPDLLRAIAILTWPGLTAPVLGPPLGGFIVQYFSWHWIFLINLPLGALGLVLAWRLVPQLHEAVRRPFDGLGFALGATLCVVLTLLLEALGEGGASAYTLGLLAAATLGLGLGFARHIGRAEHPLVSPAPLAIGTFSVTLWGGSAMRTLISAMPFLLPLLFQLGFGMDPFRAGLMVLVLFAGNVGMKPGTSWVLRRFGFRTVLLGNGLLQAATMACFALLPAAAPTPLVVALLVLCGASRSLQFTALNALAFADMPQPLMGAANTMFSALFQFSVGMGVAVGAVALRLAGTPGEPATLGAFHGAFAIVAGLMALSSLSGLLIAPDAAAVVAGRATR